MDRLTEIVLAELGLASVPPYFTGSGALADMYALVRLSRLRPLIPPDIAPPDADLVRQNVGPFFLACVTDDPAVLLAAAARRFVAASAAAVPVPLSRRADAPIIQGRPLHVGYFASDLKEGHPIGELAAPVIASHNPARVRTTVYNTTPPPPGDGIQARLKAAGVTRRNLPPSPHDAEAVRMIEASAPDIMVDLNGFTGIQRPALFAARPAPVVVNWFGSPGSTGSPAHHYALVDPVIAPPGADQDYSERLIRLPHFQPNDARRAPTLPTPSRRSLGLPDDALVFCNFGGRHKMTPETRATWLAILAGAPRSVLWLLGGPAEDDDRMRAEAAAHGVTPERLIFTSHASTSDYLARYPAADLVLDSWPFGCPTTGSDALLMGVPVLTRPGRSYISRATASVVTAAGMPDMVCADRDAFIARAIHLASDRAALVALRERAATARRSPAFDAEAFARSLEDAFEFMRDEYLAGRRPCPNDRERQRFSGGHIARKTAPS